MHYIKHFIRSIGVLILFVIGILDISACEWNVFFKINIPLNWKEGQCIHGIDKISSAPMMGNQFLPANESLLYQWAYVHIIGKEVNLKEYIERHVNELEDISLYENLCYYKQDTFHGYNALSYTFGGQCKNVKCVGKIYAFHARGFTFLFVNKFLPNKSGLRKEIDIWETLKWLPAENWKLKTTN